MQGTVSSKNVINILFKNILDCSIAGMCFWAFGFSVLLFFFITLKIRDELYESLRASVRARLDYMPRSEISFWAFGFSVLRLYPPPPPPFITLRLWEEGELLGTSEPP